MKSLLCTFILCSSAAFVFAQNLQPVDTLRKGAYGAAVWGDFDGDGKIDLAYGSQTSSIGEADSMNIYRNTGSGFEKVPQQFLYAPNPVMAAVDLDGDGKQELLYCGSGVDTMMVYTSDGVGGFSIMSSVHLPGVSAGAMAIADYNDDGFPDIFLTGFASSSPKIARIYKGGPGLSFTDIAAPIVGVINGEGKWADYDDDGLIDLVVSGETGLTDSIRVFKNMGSDVFALAAALPGGVGTVDWIDYNNDGKLDIVSALFETTTFLNRTLLYRNNGAGGFTAETMSNLPAFGEPSAVATADFNGDGKQDIFFSGGSNISSSKTVLALNTGTLIFELDTMFRADPLNCLAETADFNNDGRPDLFVSNIIVQNMGTPTAIVSHNSQEGIKVFPNPSLDKMHVEWNATTLERVNLTVTNSLGVESVQESFSQKTGYNSKEINVSLLPSGIYYLQLCGNDCGTLSFIKK